MRRHWAEGVSRRMLFSKRPPLLDPAVAICLPLAVITPVILVWALMGGIEAEGPGR